MRGIDGVYQCRALFCGLCCCIFPRRNVFIHLLRVFRIENPQRLQNRREVLQAFVGAFYNLFRDGRAFGVIGFKQTR